MATTTTITNEARHHRESAASIRLKAQKLRRALDADKLEEAVRVAADVAAELRAPGTVALTPKAYYDVYLSVCAELRVLEMYMLESARRGAPVLHLYERVQETPLVLPRLYLLVTAGAVYVRSEQAPAKDVLRDLVEMCAAVQHPQRGLFLRAYLAQMMKDKLPDIPAKEWIEQQQQDLNQVSHGSLNDSVQFVLRNFTEMNRLWVRMNNNVSVREQDNVKLQRLELRLLVGSNLSTLGRLLTNNQPMYMDKVLPAIVEQIVDCRDAIAQEYLADCVAQAFPDDFQLATLDTFLRMCAKLVRGVNLRTVLTSIIDRLTNYALTSESAKQQIRDVDAFHTFHRHFPAVLVRQQTAMALPERLRVFQSLMRFVLTLEPEKTESVDAVLALAVESAYLFVGPDDNALVEEVNGTFYTPAPISGVGQNPTVNVNPRPTTQPLRHRLTDEEERLTLQILSMPLSEYQDVAVALRLNNFGELQQLLCFEKQYTLAAKVLRSVREYKPCIADVVQLEKLFVYVKPLVVGERAAVNDLVASEDMYSPAAIFNPETLSHHHAYLSAEVSLGTWNAASANGNQPSITDAEPASEPTSLNYEEESGDPIEEQQQFLESQELVARIVFLCHNDSINGTIALYDVVRSHLLMGDARRRAVTIPPLTFAALQLAMRANEAAGAMTGESMTGSAAPTQIVHFAVACVEALVPEHPILACRLHLQLAVAGATMALAVGGDVVYDAVARAFLLFENMINLAAEQYATLEAIAGTLAQVRGALPHEAYLALARRAEKHAANLLARSDQCLALLACTSMYGQGEEEEEVRALACVDAASNAARACASTAERFFLWVAVANRIIKLVEEGCTAVGGKDRLRDVMWAMRDIVANRATKNVPLGRAALRRRALLLAHIRAHPNVFSFLNVAEL